MARKRSRKKKAKKVSPPEPVFSEVEDAFFSAVTQEEAGDRDRAERSGPDGDGGREMPEAAASHRAAGEAPEDSAIGAPSNEDGVSEDGVPPPDASGGVSSESESVPSDRQDGEVRGEGAPADIAPGDQAPAGASAGDASPAVSAPDAEAGTGADVPADPEVGALEEAARIESTALEGEEPPEIEIYESDLFDGGEDDRLEQMTGEGLDIDAYAGTPPGALEGLEAGELPAAGEDVSPQDTEESGESSGDEATIPVASESARDAGAEAGDEEAGDVDSSAVDAGDEEHGEEATAASREVDAEAGEVDAEAGARRHEEQPEGRATTPGSSRGESRDARAGEEIVVLTDIIDTVVPEEAEELEEASAEAAQDLEAEADHRDLRDGDLETTLPEEAMVALGEDTGEMGGEDAVDAADPSLLEAGDPGDLPEPPAGSEVLKLPVADVPSELGWDVIPDDLVEPSSPMDVQGGGDADDAIGRAGAEGRGSERTPVWTVPEYAPGDASEFEEALEQVPETLDVDMSSLEATARRFLDISPPLPFIEMHTVTIEEQFDEAVALLRSEAALAPSPEIRAAYHLAAARLLLGEGREEEARKAIEASLAEKDTFGPTLRLQEDVEREAERWDALLDVYETLALSEESAPERAAPLLACAEICLTRLDAPRRAVTYLEEALEAVPEDLTALRMLADAYRGTGDWQALSGVCERIAVKLPPGGQVVAYHRLGEMAQDRLGDPAAARSAWLRALEIQPDYPPSRLALEAHWTREGDLDALKRQYEQDARRLEGLAAVQAWCRVADLSEALDQHDDAIDALRQAMELDPANPALRREYQGRLARAGRWKLYVQTALNELEHSDDDDASAAIYLFIAQLYELALDDLETARGAVASALELQPGWRFAQEAQLRLLARSGHWQELCDRLVVLAASEQDSRVAAARYYQAAVIAERYLEDTSAAVDWLEAARAADPEQRVYAWVLRQALERERLWERVYGEDIAPGAWPFAAEPDPRAGDWEQRGLVAEVLHEDDTRALACYRKAFELGSRSPIALGGQLRILRRAADWPALLALLSSVQGEALSPAWQAAIAWDRARILEEHLNRVEDAADLRENVIAEAGFLPAIWQKMAALEEAGDIDACLATRELVPGEYTASPLETLMEALYWARRGKPGLLDGVTAAARNRWAYDVRELWQCESGDLDGLVETYRERLEQTPDRALAQYLRLRMAAWLEARERLEDAWTAVADVVRAGTVDPVTLNRLERLAVAADKGEELDDLLSSLTGAGEAGADIALRLARHREYRRADEEGALEAYQLAWRSEPESYEAMEGVARLADRLDLPELAGPAYAARAVALPEAADQAADWLLAGERFVRVDDGDKIEQAFSEVLARPVLKRRAFERLVQFYRSRADVDGLEILYDRWVEGESDGVVRQCLIMELADQLEALGALRPALGHFERLAVNEQYLPACLRLERIHLASEDWRNYVVALQARAEAVRAEEASAAARETVLVVQASKLREPWAMEQILQRRIEAGDAAQETIEAYRVLLAYQERWTDLAVFLEERAAGSEQQEQKVRYLLDSGWIYANKLEELDLATDRYQDILDLVEGEPEALAALVDISRRRQDWNGMVAALARKAVTLDDEAKLVAYREIARVWEEKIGDPETAVQAYQKVLELDPDDPPALGALTRLYRKLRKWPEFVDTADRWLAVRKDEDPTLLNEVGITLARRLDEPERAVPFLLRALARGQGDLEVLRGVAERFESEEKWVEAAELYERVADGVDDPDAAIDLYERTAVLCRERLQDVPRAVAVYEKVLKKAPDHLSALWSLAKIHEAAGRTEEALKLLGELVRHPGAPVYLEKLTDVERLEFHRQFGSLLSDAGFREEAAAHFQEALRFMPSDQDLLEKLAELYRAMERWDKYAEILQARIDTSPDLSRETLAQRYEDLGRALHAAGKSDEALHAYRQARDLVPNRVQTYLAMAEIYRDREDWKTLLGLYNSVIKYSPEPEQVVEAYISKADILYHHLAPVDSAYVGKAVLHYEKAVLYDRRNGYAMLRLAEIALEGRQFQKAQDWLRRVLVLEPEGRVLARTLVLGGVLCAEALKDPDAARANFEKAASAWRPLEDHLSAFAEELPGTPGKLERFLRLYRMFLPWPQDKAPVTAP